VEIVTLVVTYLTSIISILSIPLMIFILRVISRGNCSSVANTAFFTFCKVALAADILSLLTTLLLIKIPSLGWFVHFYTANDAPKRIFYFLNWATRIMQGFSSTYICINRSTAVLFPFVHPHVSA
ncbi:hypothetical protein PMAYCL1PPCAC_15071, partial [Pristionchus mayeri]